MSPFKFFYPVLNALSNGRILRTSVALALRVMGALTAIAGLYILISLLKISFNLPAEGTIGGIVVCLIVIVAVAAVVQIHFYRASDIANQADSKFTVIPMFSTLLRAAGEIYATIGTAAGLGGCLFIWFARVNPLAELTPMAPLARSTYGEGTFLTGLVVLAYAAVTSFAILILLYFLAETVVVMVDIANNTRLLVAGGTVPSKPGSSSAPDPAPASAMDRVICPACSAPIETGSTFCTSCGFRIPLG